MAFSPDFTSSLLAQADVLDQVCTLHEPFHNIRQLAEVVRALCKLLANMSNSTTRLAFFTCAAVAALQHHHAEFSGVLHHDAGSAVADLFKGNGEAGASIANRERH